MVTSKLNEALESIYPWFFVQILFRDKVNAGIIYGFSFMKDHSAATSWGAASSVTASLSASVASSEGPSDSVASSVEAFSSPSVCATSTTCKLDVKVKV